MKRSQNESTVETLHGSFRLELPDDIAVDPDYEFNVAKNYIMRVWKQAKMVESKEGSKHEQTVYVYDVRHKNGRSASERYGSRNCIGEVKDLVQLRLTAEDYAFQLRPKSRVTKVDVDEDE